MSGRRRLCLRVGGRSVCGVETLRLLERATHKSNLAHMHMSTLLATLLRFGAARALLGFRSAAGMGRTEARIATMSMRSMA